MEEKILNKNVTTHPFIPLSYKKREKWSTKRLFLTPLFFRQKRGAGLLTVALRLLTFIQMKARDELAIVGVDDDSTISSLLRSTHFLKHFNLPRKDFSRKLWIILLLQISCNFSW